VSNAIKRATFTTAIPALNAINTSISRIKIMRARFC
jgi:hypothetical protein